LGFLGRIDYLIPASRLTWQITRSLDHVLSEAAHNNSKFRVHVDAGVLDGSHSVLESCYEGLVRFSCWNQGGKKGPAACRNYLAKESDAEYLVFVDSDVILSPHFDYNLRRALDEERLNKVLYPRIKGRIDAPGPSRFFQEHVMSPLRFPNGTTMITSAVFGIRAETFRASPGFDERFHGAGGEDWLFFAQIQSAPYNLRIDFEENLVAFHENPRTMEALMERARRYARQAHLHSPPPAPRWPTGRPGNPLRPEWMLHLAMLLKSTTIKLVRAFPLFFYMVLLGANSRVAVWGASTGARKTLAISLLRLRNLFFSTVSWVRGKRGKRDTQWDSLLFLERVRYRNWFGRRAKPTPTPTPTPRIALPAGGKRLVSRGYGPIVRAHNLYISLLWRREYRKVWREFGSEQTRI
jgi:hypothetical protein